MPTASSRSAITEPQQQRSRQTLARILDAFEHALQTQTFEEVTVSALCKRARCSVGTFYGRVESKDVLLDHLRQRVFGQVQDTLSELFLPERARTMSLPDLVRQQLEVLLDFHLERRGVLRAVIVQARRQTAFAGPTREFNTAMLRLVTASWLEHREAIAHGDPVIACEQTALMIAGYLRESVVFRELWSTQRSLDRAKHLEQLTAMVLGSLAARPQPHPDNDESNAR